MTIDGQFPFGQPLRTVQQTDRTPKRVFVLGVNAGAVYARWTRGGRDVVKALAVANEPYLFWRGEGADQIVRKISIPKELGALVPAGEQFNGQTGRALDRFIYRPLHLKWEDAWQCNLVPHSCMNSGQKKAIQMHYLKVAEEYKLPIPSVPDVPEELTDEARRKAIVEELWQSQAKTVILLGDDPIRWFLRYFTDCPRRLAQFQPYGLLNRFIIEGREIFVLPLIHPRQAARQTPSSISSDDWFTRHQAWLHSVAGKLAI